MLLARFTFQRGNLSKILALPLHLLIAPLAALIPRTPRTWVFGSAAGVGDGALQLALTVRATLPDERITWLGSGNEVERAAAKLHGFTYINRRSPAGLRRTLRAELIVVTHGFGDVNRFGVHGGNVVQLWHGIPIKRLHLDSTATLQTGRSIPAPLTKLLRRAYAHGSQRIWLFPVSSPIAARRIATAFALDPQRVVVTGEPRDDELIHPDGPQAARQHAQRMLGAAHGIPSNGKQRFVLYAPTWRDGEPDPGVPSADDWQRIAETLERLDLHLIIRPHPLGFGAYREADAACTTRVHRSDARAHPNLTAMLPGFDVVITDYSSVALQSARLGTALVWFAPDETRYANTRGFYEPYAVLTEHRARRSWTEVLTELEALCTNADARAHAVAHADRLATRFYRWNDGANAQRVLAVIQQRRTATPAARMPVPPTRAPHGLVTVHAAQLTDDHRGAPVLQLTHQATAEPLLLESVHGAVTGVPTATGSRFALTTAGGTLALPSGGYTLRSTGTIASTDPGTDPGTSTDPGTTNTTGCGVFWGEQPDLAGAQRDPHDRARLWWGSVLCTLSAQPTPGALVEFTMDSPLSPEQRSPRRQHQLERAYRQQQRDLARDPHPTPRAVFFESFFGRIASCNPAAIDREIAASHPEVLRFWSVRDRSVRVPAGAVPVLEGSPEWWDARAKARVLVVNDWLRKRYRRRRGQLVLQTWHGTMLKRLALARPGFRPRAAVATLLESARWDVLLSQNAHSTATMRSSYGFRGRVWQLGYPRSDRLVTWTKQQARQALGLDPRARVVLYAPTWRDGSDQLVDAVGAADLHARLGADWLLLLRGHSRTHAAGRYVQRDGVRDVSLEPDADLLVRAADVVVTDYSSVMFDASVAGVPTVFHVPDLRAYRDAERGFTFDFESAAPGPLTATLDELVAAIRDVAVWQPEYAARLQRWQERFHPHDDGFAAQRVVRRLAREGWL